MGTDVYAYECMCSTSLFRWACSGNIHRAIASSYNHVPAGVEVPLHPHEHGRKDCRWHEVKWIVGHDSLPKEELRVCHFPDMVTGSKKKMSLDLTSSNWFPCAKRTALKFPNHVWQQDAPSPLPPRTVEWLQLFARLIHNGQSGTQLSLS